MLKLPLLLLLFAPVEGGVTAGGKLNRQLLLDEAAAAAAAKAKAWKPAAAAAAVVADCPVAIGPPAAARLAVAEDDVNIQLDDVIPAGRSCPGR